VFYQHKASNLIPMTSV